MPVCASLYSECHPVFLLCMVTQSTKMNYTMIFHTHLLIVNCNFYFTDLENIRRRQIDELSGGELQRFACAMVCIQDGDIFMFDEPSSYLDVKQRLNAAVTIRSLIHPDK